MKKILPFLVILCFNTAAFCQVVTGTVIDKKDRSKIGYATIYFNGTFIGTSSDINGDFKLDVSKSASMPLTVSCIGYFSRTLTDFSADKPLIIYLEPKDIEMNEIVVAAKSLSRKRKANLRLFKDEFLGVTAIAKSCEIMNEKDITFNYGSDRDTLKAFASKPIVINNKALGYKISYYLDKFEYDKNSMSFRYSGNMIFNEDLATDETNGELYQKNRKLTYLGSRMHFFRSLWADDLFLSGFEVRSSDNKNLSYDDLVIKEISKIKGSLITYNKFILCPTTTTLSIYYGNSLSKIVFHKPKVYFKGDGFFDYSGISWQGEMVTKRIGDSLPYEYQPQL
jgi:hypothetical protein